MPLARVNGDVELFYQDEGEGEPLVLIMGIGAQLVYWPNGFVRELVDRGFRVIRFDNRDVGLSSKLEGDAVPPMKELVWRVALGRPVDAPYTLSDMAHDVAGLLDVLGIERAHVTGVSMGGMIAQAFAIAHPERLRTLCSIMSHPGEWHHNLSRPKALLTLLKKAPRDRAEAMDRATEFYRVVGSTGFARDERELRERAGRAYDRCFYPRGFLRQLAAVAASPPRTKALGSVQAPALVVHGSVDPLILPAGGRATARALPNARLELIAGMGHDLPAGVWPIIAGAIEELAQMHPS